jgi:hypothetical protein
MSGTGSVTQPPATSLQVRVRALELSGWGERLRLVQLRNACFWVFVLGIVGGLSRISIAGPLGPYGPALAIDSLAFAVYAVPWWLYLTHLNRFGKVPGNAVLAGFGPAIAGRARRRSRRRARPGSRRGVPHAPELAAVVPLQFDPLPAGRRGCGRGG